MKKYGIICAVDSEIAPFLELAQITKTEKIANLDYQIGTIEGMEVVLVRCGMGKVNASVATMAMIQKFAPDLLINAGVNGGIDGTLSLFDCIVCDKCTHHDLPMDVIITDYPKMADTWFYADKKFVETAKSVSNCVVGAMISGEIFVDNAIRESLVPRFATEKNVATDMETAAIAQCALAMGVPYAAVRAISDTAEEEGLDAFWKNVALAAKVAAGETVKILKAM